MKKLFPGLKKITLVFAVALLMLSAMEISATQAATIFNNYNTYAVSNGPSAPTAFSVSSAMNITKITTYHWNNGSGSTPGTISLRHSDNTVYGPWAASFSTQGAPNNTYWTVSPNASIKAGSYTVIDSNTSTWSHNSTSSYAGFVIVEGDVVTTTLPMPTSQEVFVYPAVETPLSNTTPSLAKPIGVGTVANNGNTYSLKVDTGQFESPVDLYLVYLYPQKDNILYFIDSTNNPTQAFVPWRTGVTSATESLFGDVDVSSWPRGAYYVALLAMPSGGDWSSYYFWITAFDVVREFQYAPQAPKNMRYTLSGPMLTLNWDAVAGASDYKLGIGLQASTYFGPFDFGNITQLGPLDISFLAAGTYYFAVKAYNNSQESGYSNEISVTLTGKSGEMSISPSSDPLTVSGTYKVNGATKTLQFAAASQGNGKATAFYRFSDGSAEVTIDLQGADKGTITWKGITIDGYGALTSPEATAIQELTSGDLWLAIAVVPLDLGCLAKDKDPAALAALLMPWQMVLKYKIPDRAEKMQVLSRGSACSYYGNILGSKPTSAAVLLSNEDAVPYVYGYFPFDGEGAVETSSSSSQFLTAARLPEVEGKLFGPCGSRCRGACGADCPDSCSVGEEHSCIKDDQGNNTGDSTRYLVYKCGGHAGCEWHDNCFEECLTKYGCGSWGASNCMHNLFNGCDITAGYLFGRLDAITWAQGGPPWDKMLVFKYAQSSGSDPQLCSNEAKFQRLRVKYQLIYAKGTCDNAGMLDLSHYDTPQTFELTWWGGLSFSGQAPLEYGEISGISKVGGGLSPDMKTLSTFHYTDTYSYPDYQFGSTKISVLDMPLTSSSDSPKLLTFTASGADLKKYMYIVEEHDQGCYYSVLNYNSQLPMMIELIFTGQ